MSRMITYRDLRTELNKLSEDQLDLTVTYWNEADDTYYAADIVAVKDSDTIETTDAPHPVLVSIDLSLDDEIEVSRPEEATNG